MRKSKSAILEAVHETARGLHEAGVMDRFTLRDFEPLPQRALGRRDMQPPVRVLFVCSQNKLRSPTAEAVFAESPGIECASAGLNRGADTLLTPDLVEWADIIFVMEKRHQRKLSSTFRAHLRDQKVICLGIPDEYQFMQPELIELLEMRVRPHLP